MVFVGTVKSVSQLADSTRPWMTGGVKEYTTIVTLDDISSHEIKPGMTAEARILVGEFKNVLVVPIQADCRVQGRVLRIRRGARRDQAQKGQGR